MAEGLLIIGAGGHGKVVADAALEMGQWSRIAFVDDRADEMQSVAGLSVIARIAQIQSLRAQWRDAVVAIGNAALRLDLLRILAGVGFGLPAVVHPGAIVSRWATIGSGSVAFAQSAVNAGAVVGDGCIINTGATVDHDCRLGDGVHVCPGAHLAGDVIVGCRSWIGIGAIVRQSLSIGSDAVIGAGSVVVRPIADGATALGVPARPRNSGG
ncbi:MAG: acetyltransferase [Gammaproteobacteria bacterium]|nr:acetyltransferase [Gammaproteobacteria bacterium]